MKISARMLTPSAELNKEKKKEKPTSGLDLLCFIAKYFSLYSA